MNSKKFILAIVVGLLVNALSYADHFNPANTWVVCHKNASMGDLQTQDTTQVLLRKLSGNDYLMSYSVLKKDYYSYFGKWTSLVPAKVSLNPIQFKDEAGKILFQSNGADGIIFNKSTQRKNVLRCEITTEAKMLEQAKHDRVGMDPRPNQEIRKLLTAE
jgi:hypothetical protein